MVIACATESPTLREQLRGPLEPTNDENEFNEVSELNKISELQMRNREDVKKNDEELLKQDLGNVGMIANAYIKFKDEFIDNLSDFKSMWDGHLGRVRNAKHWIGLSESDAKPINSSLYHTGPKARELEKKKIGKMLSRRVIESAET